MGLSGQMKKKEEDKCIIYQHVFNITSFKVKRELGFPKCKDRRLVQEEMLRKKTNIFSLRMKGFWLDRYFPLVLYFFIIININKINNLRKCTIWTKAHYTYRSCSTMETHTSKLLAHFCADDKARGGLELATFMHYELEHSVTPLSNITRSANLWQLQGDWGISDFIKL